jgi:hypothetical protein
MERCMDEAKWGRLVNAGIAVLCLVAMVMSPTPAGVILVVLPALGARRSHRLLQDLRAERATV